MATIAQPAEAVTPGNPGCPESGALLKELIIVAVVKIFSKFAVTLLNVKFVLEFSVRYSVPWLSRILGSRNWARVKVATMAPVEKLSGLFQSRLGLALR